MSAPSSTEAPPTQPPADPDTPCLHCGLPVGRYPVGAFCCTACEAVYGMLRESGMADTYYRLQNVAPTREAAPARTELDALITDELDSERFLNEHTRTLDSGRRSADLYLDGVHCAACVWLVERLPQEMAGVSAARLDLARARLSLEWDPSEVPLSSVAKWLAQFGYSPHPLKGTGTASQAERRLLMRMGIAWSLAANVMLITLAFYAGLDARSAPNLYEAGRWMSLLLAVPALFYAGRTFFVRAWGSVRRAAQTRSLRSLDMDTPIAIGLLVGFADSARATISGTGDVWYDSLTVLVAALLTARWLQLRSRRLAGDASDRLLSLIPERATRILENGDREIVEAGELVRGERIVVEPGEVIPVDGRLEEGETRLDLSILTGESDPVPARPGTDVQAGATNLSQTVIVRVHAAGEETRVGRLLAWVRDASSRRAPVVQLADRLSGYFVATVLTLAIVAFVFWRVVDPEVAVSHVVALLVISCPCALGMATPLAMAVAVGRAAREGIFVKSEAALELLTRADTVLLDKTGTLTRGRPTVIERVGDENALRWASRLEGELRHPVATALVEAFPPVPDAAEDVVHDPGFGVSGRVGGRHIVVGQPDWVRSIAGLAWPAVEYDMEALGHPVAGSPIAVAVDGALRAVVGLGDAVRPEARSVVAEMQRAGQRVEVLSGDATDVVAEVAAEVGIEASLAQGRVSPEQKLRAVESRQLAGRTVVMVGDGVNDAAALVQSDVGIAVAGGTTASLVAADVFLTEQGLLPLRRLMEGSRSVMRVIRRNLGISLAYNAVAAVAAFAGLVSPLVAAIAMPISSLVVVLSSIGQSSFRQRHRGLP